jgi:hypothetical protein
LGWGVHPRESGISAPLREDVMAKVGKDQDFDSFFNKVGPDATSTFDNSSGDSTDFANSEATDAATFVAGDGESALEEEDDDLAAEEEDDEDNEEEDVEDDADLNR